MLKKKVTIESKYKLVKIPDIAENLFAGGDLPKNNYSKIKTEEYQVPIFSNGIQNEGLYGYTNIAKVTEPCITISARGTIGYPKARFVPFYPIVRLLVLIPKKELAEIKYLEYALSMVNFNQYSVATPQLTVPQLSNFFIPLPPMDIQQKIVSEIKEIESMENSNNKKIDELTSYLLKPQYFEYPEQRIDRITIMVQRGKSAKYGKSNIQIIKSGQARGYMEFDFSQKHYVSESFVSDERNLAKGDLLINSSGVGTAGRVTLFNLDGEFVVDSHVTIVRFNKDLVNPKYALYAFANIGFKTIEKMATGQSGQIELALPIINNIRIPLPPIETQNKIVREIEAIETEIANLKAEISNTEEKKKAVLTKYLQ